MSEEIESYLFIGGVKDGEWFNLPRGLREYNFPIYTHRPLMAKDVPQDLRWENESIAKYIKIKIGQTYGSNHKGLFVYVSQDLYDAGTYTTDTIWQVMCKLVNNYKVIK